MKYVNKKAVIVGALRASATALCLLAAPVKGQTAPQRSSQLCATLEETAAEQNGSTLVIDRAPVCC